MRCPKCGREAGDDAVICGGCDFILDSSFLGDDIMDAEADRRVKAKEPPSSTSTKAPPAPSTSAASSASPAPKKRKGQPAKDAPNLSRGARESEPANFSEKTRAAPAQDGSWAADALILGDLDDDEVASFQASDTGLAQREVTMARMYVGGSIQALLMPDAIPEIAPDFVLEAVRVTPFERHVLELVNGKRPVARIKAKARLKDDDFQTALALLADKGFLQLKGRAKKVKKKPAPPRTPRIPSERTLIAELPSAHELDVDDDAQSDAGRFGFSDKTGPGPESVQREHTLIQPAPRFDSDDGDADGQAARDAGADADVSEVDRGPLSFADSLVSEEDVFASAEEVLAQDADAAARVKPALPRAHRRPPLPGEVPAQALAAVEQAEAREAAAAPEPGADAPGFSIHDEPTSDTRLGAPESSSFRSSPPPLPIDASQEARPSSAVEAEAVAFEDLETGLPSPLSVSAGDISLIEVATPAAPVPSRPPSLTTGTLAVPPHTDPKPPVAIEVSDFSDPVVTPGRVVTPPPLPGGNVRPPGVPGAAVSPARAPVPRAAAAPAQAAAPSAPHEDKSEEQPAPDSDSGEEPPGAQVSFEMRRKAARIFEQAEKDIAAGNASSAIMNVKLALIYNPGEKRYRQFLQDWERMQAGEPAKASKEELLLEEAQALEQKGEHEEALAILQKALERAPRNAGLHNRIGVLMATRLKRYKEAAEHVLKAIDLAPGNLAYKNNLGKILAKEESAIHKMPIKKSKKKDKDDDRVIVKKLRPKLF